MQPIVDGLEKNYRAEVEFQLIDVGTSEGLGIFSTYSILGHPGYLILNEQGEVLWQSVGEQPGAIIEDALKSFLDE